MKVIIEQLQEQLEQDLRETTAIKNKIDQYRAAIDVVLDYAGRAREIILIWEQPFFSQRGEILYFRHTAPYFYSRLYYYRLLYNLEVYRAAEDKEGFKIYLAKKLQWAKGYLAHNGRLHRYCHSHGTYWDQDNLVQTPEETARGYLFCKGSQKIALILACERFRDFLHQELESGSKEIPEQEEILPSQDNENCKLSKTEAVALAVSLYEGKFFLDDGQPETLEQVVQRTERLTNLSLENFSGLDQSGRRSGSKASTLFNRLGTFWARRADKLEGKEPRISQSSRKK